MLGAPGRTQKKLHLLAGLGLNLLGEQKVSVVREGLDGKDEWMDVIIFKGICVWPTILTAAHVRWSIFTHFHGCSETMEFFALMLPLQLGAICSADSIIRVRKISARQMFSKSNYSLNYPFKATEREEPQARSHPQLHIHHLMTEESITLHQQDRNSLMDFLLILCAHFVSFVM